MDEFRRQLILIDLLNYTAEGNFAVFDRIARKVWRLESQTFEARMLVHNQLQACQMGGFIDTVETETSLRWSASLNGCTDVLSNSPKRLHRRGLDESTSKPLVVDSDGNALLMGSSIEKHQIVSDAFSFEPKFFFSLLPSIQSLSAELIRAEPWIGDENFQIEAFDQTSNKWREVELKTVASNGLIRAPGEFSGRIYQVVIPDLQLAYRIRSPEWAFLLAAKILNWDLSEIFKYDGQNLTFHSAMKMPSLLRRFLFANCQQVQCGSETKFIKFCPVSYKTLISYLQNTELV